MCKSCSSSSNSLYLARQVTVIRLVKITSNVEARQKPIQTTCPQEKRRIVKAGLVKPQAREEGKTSHN